MSSKEFTAKTFEWLYQVNADFGLPPSAMKLCVQLTVYFNEDRRGAAWPSCKTLADNIGMSEGNVIRLAHLIEARGHLRVKWGKPGRGHPNRYSMAIKPQSVQRMMNIKPQSVQRKPQPVEENHLKNHPIHSMEARTDVRAAFKQEVGEKEARQGSQKEKLSIGARLDRFERRLKAREFSPAELRQARTELEAVADEHSEPYDNPIGQWARRLIGDVECQLDLFEERGDEI